MQQYEALIRLWTGMEPADNLETFARQAAEAQWSERRYCQVLARAVVEALDGRSRK